VGIQVRNGVIGGLLIISQVVPSPQDASVPLVRDYQAALKAAYPDEQPGYVSLEGYATGRMLGLGLEKAGSEPTRTGLLSALEGLAKEDLGGMTLSFAADDHQGSDQVYITQISAGAAKPVTTLSK
jgi:branched-chain amino acid transport system substrate-binding protein